MRTDYKASRDNSIATGLYYIGWFELFSGVIVGLGAAVELGLLGVIFIYAGVASGLVFMGIAEIIFILDDSRRRLYLLTESKSDNEAEPEKLPEL